MGTTGGDQELWRSGTLAIENNSDREQQRSGTLAIGNFGDRHW
ncbi:MAG: hypothetical protein AB4426_34890 [Xenococcaceae cyanobacterium]